MRHEASLDPVCIRVMTLTPSSARPYNNALCVAIYTIISKWYRIFRNITSKQPPATTVHNSTNGLLHMGRPAILLLPPPAPPPLPAPLPPPGVLHPQTRSTFLPGVSQLYASKAGTAVSVSTVKSRRPCTLPIATTINTVSTSNCTALPL